MISGPILAAALALLAGHGAAASAIVGAMTLQQWLAVDSTVLGDAPDVIRALDALPAPRGPGDVLPQLQQALLTGVTRRALRDWLAANGRRAIAVQDESIRHQR